MNKNETPVPPIDGVAIIGMAGRFPGAQTVAQFWENQLAGVEAISHFRAEELEVPGAQELAKQSNYIRARGVLKDIDLFDAEFFGMLPREAELTDPQHRLFLECCWETLEDAGYDPYSYSGNIGVMAGVSIPSYFLSRLCKIPGFIDKFTSGYQIDNYAAMLGNSLDFLATRVSYKFNLRGPAFTLQAGCSTSLLAICQACQSLLTYQADMMLAGGVSITFPQKRGYFYQEGGMGSADGHTRTFDENAQGTVFGSGVAIVLLKRWDDALRDGDQVYAVIRGFAVNNDGSAKVGYTAPSIDGQANVISMAQEAAGVDPSSIGYVEAHGTGTPLGDPVELSALTRAFRAKTDAVQFCAIGTAKTNVGHLDIAAGATGLIHAAHIVRYGKLPPTLHFEKPNPNFDLAHSPLYVNTKLRNWERKATPRRAGVSAFGVGGTNAHLILEEPPANLSQLSGRAAEILILSARSENALSAATKRLTEHLEENSEVPLADVAFTLAVGRHAFNHRRFVVARDPEDAVSLLGALDARRVATRKVVAKDQNVAFLFPGQGSQQPNMGRELYETEQVFRGKVDECAELLEPHLGSDLRSTLYPAAEVTDQVRDQVTRTIFAQPAIFIVEYALAHLWMSWGIAPNCMIGHSIGEFVAACLAGVFSLREALQLIAVRGRLMQSLPRGAMLSVRLKEGEIQQYLRDGICLAAVNGPSLCVVAGPIEAVASLEEHLTREDVIHRRLHTSHAFHSSMMDPALEPFCAEVRKCHLQPPKLPFISGFTGHWITSEQAVDPDYWARHMREAVQFSRGIAVLRQHENLVLLEVGPGTVLSTLARQQTSKSADQVVVSSLGDSTSNVSDNVAVQQALGWLWLAGVQLEWPNFYAQAKRTRVSLPTYPFERKRFWLELPAGEKKATGQFAESGTSEPALSPSQSNTATDESHPTDLTDRTTEIELLIAKQLRTMNQLFAEQLALVQTTMANSEPSDSAVESVSPNKPSKSERD